MDKFTTEFDDYAFPDEIKSFPQWVVCWADKIPMYSPGFNCPLQKASPTDPSTWMTFEQALNLCELNEGLLPGFVLTQDDPFTVLDFDVKPETTADHLEWYNQIIAGAQTYTERSANGQGVHLWLLADCGEGKRSSAYSVERYSRERFIICTGNVVLNAPIGDGRGVLQYMEKFLDTKLRKLQTIPDGPQVESDEDVVSKIEDWENGSKFTQLMVLPFQQLHDQLGYPTGSEADSALINFLVKASPNNAQVKRLFRTSALAHRGPKPGQKDKIMADDKYLDRTIDNMRAYVQADVDQKRAEQEALIAMSQRNIANMMENVEQDRLQMQQQLAVQDAKYEVARTEFGFPPGVIGELAKWIYSISTFPVPVYSITTALAIATTLTAKGWKFKDKHLNAYYIIAGLSGTGKNIVHRAIGKVVRIMKTRAIPADELFCSDDMRSTIAWRKHLIKRVNYCQIMPEIGTLFDDLNSRANSNADEKKGFLLNQYSAGQEGVSSGGALRSNEEDSTEGADTELTLSLIGETTLESLFNNLTGKMASSGFMSRFNYGVYEGNRGQRNHNTNVELPAWIHDYLDYVFRAQAAAIESGNFYDIPTTEAGQAWIERLDAEIQEKIGEGSGVRDETLIQIYNRVQERVERMAGTLAVFRKPEAPVVDVEDLDWAYSYVNSNTRMMLEKYRAGEVGELNDSKVRRIVATAIVRYFSADLGNSRTELRYIPHQKRRIFLKGPIQSRCYTQLQKLEQARVSEKPGRALWRILQEFTSEGLIQPLSETDKTLLANPTAEGIEPITIAKTTEAWFITDLEGLNNILN